ncbi:hypothetical protein KSS87_015215, partial [Heliosperma pusillum]
MKIGEEGRGGDDEGKGDTNEWERGGDRRGREKEKEKGIGRRRLGFLFWRVHGLQSLHINPLRFKFGEVPGDVVLDLSTMTLQTIKLGGGLRQDGDAISVIKAGKLRFAKPNKYWVEGSHKR